MKPLSDAEVAAYRRDGFLVPRFRLEPELLAELQSLTARTLAANPMAVDQPLVGVHIPGSGRQKLAVPEGFVRIATEPRILDLVEQLIGPDIILWGSVLFHKRAHEGPPTPWHRDAVAYPIEPMATTSIWIAATESTRENGCLRFIPGSHRAQEVGAHDQTPKAGDYFAGTLDGEAFDEVTAVDVELEPGQMVVFDVFTIHGARANAGTKARGGYSLRFMPGTSVYHHDAAQQHGDLPGYGHETRALMLVRGRDRTGRNDFERAHPAKARIEAAAAGA